MATREALETQARAYLDEQLGDRAPRELQLVGVFEERPLAGEGQTAIFAFQTEPANEVVAQQPAALHYYVVVGETEPNYYPTYGFDAEDAYSLHIGTRFMLGMNMTLVDAPEDLPDARQAVTMMVRDYLPDAAVGEPELATVMRCAEDLFAVYRVSVNDQQVYFMGADLPPGFYELTEHPPQVALRLHLGKLIRQEAAAQASEPQP
jgi:hypothetical protein